MEPNARLVQDVNDPHQARANLGRQPNPLRLAAAERLGRAIEREVAEPDIVEEAELRVELLEHLVRDRPVVLAEMDRSPERQRLLDRHRADLRDALAVGRLA